MNLSFRFCLSWVFLTRSDLLSKPAPRVYASSCFLGYSRHIKHSLAGAVAELFGPTFLERPLFQALPTLKAFIDPKIFFNKLSHLYFSFFNKIKTRAFPMKYITFLMVDFVSEYSALFELFILRLKSRVPQVGFNSARNIQNILELYDIPPETYAPLILGQVVDLLKSSAIFSFPARHCQVLKDIACILSDVLRPPDFREMVLPLFDFQNREKMELERVQIRELCELIQLFQPSKAHQESLPQKKRLSKSGTSSFVNFKSRGGAFPDGPPGVRTKPQSEQKMLRPTRLYSRVQKTFSSCATTRLLFERPSPGYFEYTQNVLQDFEKLFDQELNIRVSFFEDPKEPFKSEKCSHYAVARLRDQVARRAESNNEGTLLSGVFNRAVLLNAAKELTNILEVEKLEKQSGNWEMVMPTPVNKKVARQYRPKGQCLATLFSNKGRLKVLARGRGNLFFSGSDQGEVRVFDFDKFADENEPLLRSRIDMGAVNDSGRRPKRHSFSTCPDT